MNLLKNQDYLNSLKQIKIPFFLSGKTILISGVSGTLGSCLADAIMVSELPCKVIGLGRDLQKAQERFAEYRDNERFIFIQQDVCVPLENFSEHVDFIIHTASNADPVNMAKYPVDTLLSNVLGTKNLMEYGMVHGMERFLYVSSGEAYGQPNENQDDFTEDYCGSLDLSNPRSCYPEGKRAAEVLCQSYRCQYGVDVVIVRPCHLFGPTMSRNDSRAVAQFLWSAVDGRDILLKSEGLRERSHCYVVDAVQGLLAVLKKGKSGQAYNIADERYQMTIREFAERVAKVGRCEVKFEAPSLLENKGYSQISRQILNTNKLRALGWSLREESNSKIEETVMVLTTRCV